ncbi:discoidin domain-containing protein [Streptomyces lunaelactis]|uniref:discoidin domain-containing protein n=1 Tax=Streptomyces lunaelactis TaxID=1535768 RepID=UPI0015847581|nr:discoidin domain-containing protein [Streptomyces lunaelactis]NUK26235.1 discoidin domain-containing protein [Streptomyces lunaelactis]
MEPAAPVLPREGWTATASDEETTTDNRAARGLDGDPDNLWHSTWYGTVASFPHSITIDKHRTAVVSAIVYRPRTGSVNGRIGKYTVHLKPEGGDRGPALANTLLNITAVATAMSGEESAAPSASSAPAAPSAERTERLIVGYKPKAPEARSDEAVGEETTTKAAQAGEKLLFDRRLGTGAALVDLGGVQPATGVAALIRFRADPDAAYVVPGYPVQALATTAPNEHQHRRRVRLHLQDVQSKDGRRPRQRTRSARRIQGGCGSGLADAAKTLRASRETAPPRWMVRPRSLLSRDLSA